MMISYFLLASRCFGVRKLGILLKFSNAQNVMTQTLNLSSAQNLEIRGGQSQRGESMTLIYHDNLHYSTINYALHDIVIIIITVT